MRDNKSNTAPKPKTADKPKPITLNKEARKLSAPTRRLNNSYLGINDLMSKANEKKVEVQEETTDNRPTDSFSIDELRMTWRKFAFKAKEEGMGTLYTAMIGNDPEIAENYLIKHRVDNDVQMGFIKTHETTLVGYLRKELNNWSINLSIIEETVEGGGKFFSSQDKFNDMAERNPHLTTLRQKFKLDIDF
ncbi:hypothetical protein [Brumimicrobium oceani]|uniref:DNA polymerase III subunit gamma/tau n=1 Tax=Brumimicrobium oceani TaxID=2100725 RepID=A0A2U2XFU3_9FLAO|nr:hypothetical protein [Brumimicrobium oceani]PWH86655.1 hypothetical protein DIT68_05330 [Brumimicrobium oceani]